MSRYQCGVKPTSDIAFVHIESETKARVALYRGGKIVFELRDDEFWSAINSGELTTPQLTLEPEKADWIPHLQAYARKHHDL